MSTAVPAKSAAPAIPQSNLSGAQKAAILLLKLGQAHSAKVLKLLGDQEVTQITAEIVKSQTIKKEDSDVTLTEFATLVVAGDHMQAGGFATAQQLLEASLGPQRALEIIENLKETMAKAPFEFLKNADPRQILNFLSSEHPQTIALVLAHVNPDIASMVVGGLPEELQREVSIRIATLDQTSPEVITLLEGQLEKRMSSVVKSQTNQAAADGVQTLIAILNRSDRATERSIFEGLEHHNEELADEVRSRMFVFEDIVTLDDRAVQLVLRQVDAKELATALKGVRAEVREKIMRNMSERAAQNLAEEITLLGAVKMKTVEEAQGAIVRVIRALEESGQVVVTRGTDEYVS
ncbi:MAG: flagellar motor switch protein FliG [Actinobacteria bacterium]|nr:flagellar motor switch protein FliG [Actinomycetota bacterium]